MFWKAWYGYTLTFDANGGQFSHGVTQQHVVSDVNGKFDHTVVGTVPHPTRDGYTFLGWSSVKKDTGTAFDVDLPTSDFTLTSDKTYYAVWRRKPRMVFHGNGGTLDGLMSMEVVSTCDDKGDNCHVSASDLARVPQPSRSGYTFTGWNSKQDGTGTVLDLTADHQMADNDKDEDWYAQYRLSKYTVTFHAGTGGHVLSLSTAGSNLTWENQTADYPASEDADHPFTSGSSDASNLSGENTSVTPNVQRLGGTYRAESPAGTHTYSRTEPDGTPYSVTVRDERLFEGWSTANPATQAGRVSLPTRLPLASGESDWPASLSSLTDDGTSDLYALYSSVSFDLNDQDPDSRYKGKAVMDNPDSSDPTGFPSAHWIGHVFLGWREEDVSTGKPIDTSMTCIPGATSQDVSETINGTTRTVHVYGCGALDSAPSGTVYQAQWQDVRYKIHYIDGKSGSTLYKLDEDATDPTDDEMGTGFVRLDNEAHNTYVTTPNAIDPTVMDPSATDHRVSDSYKPLKLSYWVAYRNGSRTGVTDPLRTARTPGFCSSSSTYCPDDWNSSSGPTVASRVSAGSHFEIVPESSDWQKLDATHLTMSQLGPVRTIYLYGLFQWNTVSHLPSAGGTDRLLLLMAPLLLLVIVGALVARRRGLVPVAPAHGPLHVAPRARHAA